MKTSKIYAVLFCMLFIYQSAFCQAPQGFKYQAVCRDNAGDVLQNQSVSIRLAVHDGNPAGTIVYQETFEVITNQFGLITVDVGSGTVQSGDFASIPWETGNKFLEVELDLGTGYTSMGTTQLLSVPYALHAVTSERLTNNNSWTLLGNAETNEAIHFIGTSDNVSLNFRVNNQKAGKIHPAGQVFMGYQAGNSNLMDHATGFGYQALSSNTSGDVNSAFGYKALSENITGSANTAFGNEALRSNTSGDWSTAVGVVSLVNNTIGTHNTALGALSLLNNTIGVANTASGYGSIMENNEGTGNTGFGMYALKGNTTGSYNTSLGLESGYNIGDGSNNVFLGYQAGYNETGSNKLYIANSSNYPPLIYGDFSSGRLGIGTTNTVQKLTVAGNMEIQADGAWIPGATARLYLGPDNNMWIEHIHSGGLNLEVCSGWPFYVRNGGNVTLSIDGSGNVGIGTSTPAALLDVNGVIMASAGNSDNWNLAYTWGNHADAGYLTSVEDVTVGNEITDATNSTLTRSGSGTHVDPYTLALNAGNTNTWTGSQTFNANTYFPGTSVWTSTGRVGIGTTNPGAGSKLEVWDGNITVLNGGVLANTGFWGDILRTNWGNDLTLQSSYANKGIVFRTQSGEKMRIDAAGNVGIGTNTPASILHLIGDTPRFKIQTQTNLTDPSIEFIKYGVRTMEIKLSDGGGNTGLQFIDQNSEQVRMFIKASNGNVGIGTTTPAASLDVNGQVKIAGGAPGAGKVLTSDAAGLATWETPASAGSHYISEMYGGGIVFYVYDNGQHGLIAATSDQSAGIQWSNGLYKYTGTTGDGLGAGAMNTAMIVATQMGDNETGNFAAKVCADFAVTDNGIVYGDWYLPSKYESDLLYLQKDIVGGFSDADYWTSTEESFANSFAKHRYFGNGAQTFPSDVKYHAFRVRAIRAF